MFNDLVVRQVMLPPVALHAIGQASRVPSILRFAKLAQTPALTQEHKLLEILRMNADTEFGARAGFRAIRSMQEYAERVPMMTTADLQPHVSRLMAGEREILTKEPPLFYTRTSGSGGHHKHVPITQQYRKDFQKTVHTALGHLYLRYPRAFSGRALYFVGTRRFETASDGLDIGTMSGYNFNALPSLLRSIYAWPYELFEVADLSTRSYLALYLAMVSGTSLIAGIFPAPIVYLLRDLERNVESFARDFRDGTLHVKSDLSSAQRAFFSPYIKKRSKVAARLASARSLPEITHAAMPSLHLVYCWLTATAGLYVPELRRRLGPDVVLRDAIYAASEAWCSIPMGDEEPGGALAIESAYYEFIPEAEFETEGTRSLHAGEVEVGKRYFLIVTTSAGLYRYILGDVVEVSGFYRATPKIRFVRRQGGVVNLVGENVDEDHVATGIARAAEKLAIDTTWFAWAADTSSTPPRYVMWFESPSQLSHEQLQAFAQAVEEAVGKVALDYWRVRNAHLLAPLAIEQVPTGSYERVRRARLRDGSAEAQLKVTALYPNLEVLRAFLAN